MKKYVSALALAAILGAPAAQAAEFDFGGDFETNMFTVDTGAGDDFAATAFRLRVKANAKTDAGVQVNTRFNVLNNFQAMEQHSLPAGSVDAVYNQVRPTTVLSLDYGYLQLPIGGGWNVRAGRQESNWADCFVSCDDRRDRILALGKVGPVTLVGTYDKFIEGDLAADDDLNLFAGAAVGVTGGWLWSLLLAQFEADDASAGAALDGALLVSPYVKGKIGPVAISGAYRYFENAAGVDEGNSAFLRAGFDFGIANIEGQAVWSDETGGINAGFDSFSSQINNNPTYDRNFLSTANIGTDTTGGALRVSGKLGNQFRIIGAGGVYDGDTTELTFAELRGEWLPSANTAIWATAGRLNVDTGATDTDTDAFSLNVKTSF
jgi:hypothetical protein